MLSRAAVLLGVVASLVIVGLPLSVADPPSWNWQATWTYDTQGSPQTSRLDSKGSKWLDCTGSFAVVLSETASTTNMSTQEIDRMDTIGMFVERVRQQDGQVVTTRWQCSSGVEVDQPSEGAAECQVGLVGIPQLWLTECPVSCFPPAGALNAAVQYSVMVSKLHGHCGGADAECTPALVAAGPTRGGCIGAAPVLSVQPDGRCFVEDGIVISGGGYQ